MPPSRRNRTSPATVPMVGAAAAPVGMNPVTRKTRLRDALWMVFGPLALPALAMMLARGTLRGLDILDVAFASVAVSVAAITRAHSTKNEYWLTLGYVGALGVGVQMTIAGAVDTKMLTEKLLEAIRNNATDAMALSANAIESKQANDLQWWAVGLITAFIATWSLVLIARER